MFAIFGFFAVTGLVLTKAALLLGTLFGSLFCAFKAREHTRSGWISWCIGILGFVVLFYLTDRPAQAHWLTPEEREWLVCELQAERAAVVNLTDDILLFTQAALGDPQPPVRGATAIDGAVLAGACSWREVRVGSADRSTYTSAVGALLSTMV